MGKSNLLTGISLDVETFKAHLKRISKENYKVHQLDKDLLLEKVRSLYDNVLNLEVETGQQYSTPTLKKEEKIIAKPEVEKNVELETEFKPKAEIKPEKEVEKEIKPEVELKVEPKKEAEPEPKAEETKSDSNEVSIEFSVGEDVVFEAETKEKPEIKTEPKKEEIIQPAVEQVEIKKEETSPSMDLFSTTQETLSDKLGDKEQKSIADKLNKSKVSDIRSAIGINDKFLFINELFNGDMSRYNKALDELNFLPTLVGAETYLMELQIEKQWDTDSDAYLKFKELIERKFN